MSFVELVLFQFFQEENSTPSDDVTLTGDTNTLTRNMVLVLTFFMLCKE